MLLYFLLVSFLSISPAYTTRVKRSSSTSPLSRRLLIPREAQGDPCGQVFDGDFTQFAALDAYRCLTSVPINRTVASDFLQYYRDTLEFQSTLTYLKNPPLSYQQPGTDLLGGLDRISRQLDTDVFNNQYDFEVAVLDLVYSAHDGHTYLYGGASNVFSFGSPFEICAVSIDGIKPPQVFIAYDLSDSLIEGYTASPIATVNGQPVLEYYKNFAAINSQGYLDSHAEWNDLMYSPAANILGTVGAYTGSSPFYPGDVFSLVLENGTGIGDWTWLAVLNDANDAGAVTSVSEFYDNFVAYDGSEDTTEDLKKRKRADSSATAATAVETATPSATPTAWSELAYPADPFVYQPNLGEGGVLTGYLIEDSTAVLSIPTFNMVEDDIPPFTATVAKFLTESKARGAKKIVIDLQQNYGGVRLLATKTFKQFFPSIDPYSGSRGRANDIADALGNTYTNYYNTNRDSLNQSFIDYFSQSLWVAPQFLNAETNQAFATWAEYFGPHEDRLDYFTTTQRDNLSSVAFTENNLGEAISYGYNHPSDSQPYDAQDIVILTDGLCSSTCAVFVEMMHHEAGVKTVVVGGQPQLLGPMQAVAGSRGARDYESDTLDIDIFGAAALNSSVSSQLPDRDIDFYLDTANVNYQDQIRRGENFPLQFAYEAANCRIYHTPDTIFDMSALWQRAARATWTDPSLCVKYSTNHPSSTSKKTDTVGPSPAQKSSWTVSSPSSPSSTPHNNISIPLSDLTYDQEPESDISGREGAACNPSQPGFYCQQLACVQAPWCSPEGIFYPLQFQCVRLARDKCPKGQTVGMGSCKLSASGKCEFCKARVPITSQSCGTSTSKVGVPDDRLSQPRRPGGIGGRGRGGRG